MAKMISEQEKRAMKAKAIRARNIQTLMSEGHTRQSAEALLDNPGALAARNRMVRAHNAAFMAEALGPATDNLINRVRKAVGL